MADYNSSYTGAQIDEAVGAVWSGTVTASSCTGNAASATKLKNARTVDGVSFDGTANIETRRRFFNQSVAASAFAADTTYADYPFRASVSLSGVTADMTPEVVFGCAEALSGNFAPVCACCAGGVYLYAACVPDAAITIPTITCWK